MIEFILLSYAAAGSVLYLVLEPKPDRHGPRITIWRSNGRR